MTDFWTERYKTLGHTGWKNPVIYAYDQLERLAIISEQVEKLELKPLTALDFGCGTGDFSQLLLDKGFSVLGYDPYVEPEIIHPNFRYIRSRDELDNISKVELILSVTVLDHFLEDQHFKDELLFLRTKISANGFLILLEYISDEVTDVSSEYQAYRIKEQWQEHLTLAGWHISTLEPVPRPTTAPSAGFNSYRSHFWVRFLEKLHRYPFVRPLTWYLLQKQARISFARFGLGKVASSSLKIAVCVPI